MTCDGTVLAAKSLVNRGVTCDAVALGHRMLCLEVSPFYAAAVV